MSTKGNQIQNDTNRMKRKSFPWNYGSKIATATGYSRQLVYLVASGKHENQEIQRLLDLALADRLAFAQELEKLSFATKILNNI